MKLYLREQVEAFAFEKWGGSDGLDQEWERRVAEKEKKKEKEYAKKLKDLRRRTRTSLWAKKSQENNDGADQEQQHQHVFEPDEGNVQTCQTCGLSIEVDEF